jgi:hypothetical protein
VGEYPRVIASPKALKGLADRWGVAKVPAVDFDRYVLVVATTLGPEPHVETVVDGKGNLEFTPQPSVPRRYKVRGVKFAIKAVDRTGVKTAFGHPLPVE